jgi:hypothetical protein
VNAPAKLGVYGLVLAVVLGGGVALGDAVGPIDAGDADGAPAGEHDDTHDPASAGDPEDAGPEHQEDLMPAGLSITEDGYTLVADDTIVEAPAAAPFLFRITDPAGDVVRDFEPRHERDLHLVAVSADLSTYAHLHPTRADDGTWSVTLGDLAPGTYRTFADFAVAGGPELTLGVDVSVPGDSRPAPLPAPTTTAAVDDYDVTLTGAPAAGTSTEVTLTVSRGGRPVTDLEPYLGAFGHLVAIRAGDLGYLHVHPTGDEPTGPTAAGGPAVSFAVEVPSPGDYRLFFDFSHEGQVRTAAFTLHVPAHPGDTGGAPADGTHEGDGGHG